MIRIRRFKNTCLNGYSFNDYQSCGGQTVTIAVQDSSVGTTLDERFGGLGSNPLRVLPPVSMVYKCVYSMHPLSKKILVSFTVT